MCQAGPPREAPGSVSRQRNRELWARAAIVVSDEGTSEVGEQAQDWLVWIISEGPGAQGPSCLVPGPG